MPTVSSDLDIAIIGHSGRFPGARTTEQFWKNLCDGVESISFFSDAELLDAGVPPDNLHNPAYVKARGVLRDVDLFDASFFGLTPREAEITDPQQRVFLECAYEALENAAYAPSLFQGMIGVFGGVSENTYIKHLESNPECLQMLGPIPVAIANRKDHLCTRVSYKLNLRGPSMLIQTACSTALVAVHVACRSLLAGECDLALAGAVCIVVPEISGYIHEPGSVASSDGHCRPFDEAASGTVAGNGAGVVVLKRLAAAVADGDFIHAVIKGSSINNDGRVKIGYTAPGIEGQAFNVSQAQLMAEVDPEQVSYVEAFGTGTSLGDPIEIAALAESFQRDSSLRTRYCAIGSVKGNIGHLDTAAGMAGLIKTVLALEHKQIPPTVHFQRANPKIDFANGPFYVNDRLRPWESSGEFPRTAGVNAYGIGGTNAHVIVQEAPPRRTSEEPKEWQLLLLSAKSPSALQAMATNLAGYLDTHPEVNFADVCYTLISGRDRWPFRKAMVCRNREEAILLLRSNQETERVLAGIADSPQTEKELAGSAPLPELLECGRSELLAGFGSLWVAGVDLNWATLYPEGTRQRIPLPSYPFEHQRYWLERNASKACKVAAAQPGPSLVKAFAAGLHPRPSLSVPYVSSRGVVQDKIAEIWEQSLGFQQIGVHDNFYELGGDSLLAGRTAARIRDAFMVDFRLEDFFKGPTIARIAAVIHAHSLDPDRQVFAIQPVSRREWLPLSFEEELYWWIAQLDARYMGCNVLRSFHLMGDLDQSALSRALDCLVQRHEILRTGFVAEAGEARRVIDPAVSPAVSTIDLQGIAPELRESEARRISHIECSSPFDLASPPLFRIKLLHLAEREHVLILVFHHILADEWSIAVFADELRSSYDAFCRGETPSLPELPFQYGDYATWQRKYFSGQRLASLDEYWKKQLDGMKALPFAQRQDTEATANREARYFFSIGKDLTEAARRFSRAETVTLFSTLLAVFDLWIYRQTGSTDIAVAVPIAKRPHRDLERTLGLFATTIILRTAVSDQPGFRRLLRRVHRIAEEGYAHQDMPLKRLLQTLELKPGQGSERFSHVVFNFLRVPPSNLEFQGLVTREFPLTANYSNSEQLHLSVRDHGDTLAFAVTYKTVTFTAQEIANFAEEYSNLLTRVIASPEEQIGWLWAGAKGSPTLTCDLEKAGTFQ